MIKWCRLFFSVGIKLIGAEFHGRKILKNKEKYTFDTNYAYAHQLANKLNKGFRGQFIISGQEYLKDLPQQVFFVSNHNSNLDPLSMLAYSDRPISFLAKASIKKYFAIGKILQSIEGSFIDREDIRSEIKVFHQIDALLDKYPNLSYVAFPEGTRSHGPNFELAPFHGGTFKIATRRGLPIVPIVTYLNARLLDQKCHFHKYPIQVRYLKPIMPEEYAGKSTGQIALILHERIEEALNEEKALDLKYIMELNHYSEEKAKKVQKRFGKKTI